MSTFESFPKIPRWNRSVVVTEKIDGTNGAIIIEEHTNGDAAYDESIGWATDGEMHRLAVIDGSVVHAHSAEFHVYAQSRTRLVRPGTGREAGNDNYGFAAWVQERAEALVKLLGPGRHFGEFYGKGIARNYGLDHRRFALFNTKRWRVDTEAFPRDRPGPYALVYPLELDVVPVLATLSGPSEMDCCDLRIDDVLYDLGLYGSALVPGFDKPEGVVLYHTAAGQTFKILLEGDELPKGVVPRAERELEAARAA